MDFKNKVVVITGASSGIGAATARLFADYSAKLVLVGRKEENLKKVAAEVNAKGAKSLIVKADLVKDEDVKKIVEETIKEFGQIDVLVNNAGAGVVATFEEGIEHFDNMIAINLRSVYLLSNLALPHLKKTKGVIINVSSVASEKPVLNFIPYCISKAGLDMFTKGIAKELAAYGIRVNSVNPGPTDSEFHDRLGLGKEKTDEMMNVRAEMSALKKIATMQEMADVIVFLASDKAKSTTGSIYVVDNGFLL